MFPILLAVVLAGLAIWGLTRLFPGRVTGGEDVAQLARLAIVLTLAAALVASLRMRLGEAARGVALWIGIIALLVFGYTIREELGQFAARVRSELTPGQPVKTAEREMLVTRDGDGQFVLVGQVNGRPVRFLVDTGASGILLSPEDAQRVGVDMAALRYVRQAETANGVGRSAPFIADTLRIGDIRLTQVEMAINQAPLSVSLLGMSFLDRLESFQIRGDRLYLRWRG